MTLPWTVIILTFSYLVVLIGLITLVTIKSKLIVLLKDQIADLTTLSDTRQEAIESLQTLQQTQETLIEALHSQIEALNRQVQMADNLVEAFKTVNRRMAS